MLIAIGLLMFAFVAYQLWGTGIENAAAQRALEDDFEELLAEFEPFQPSPVESSTTDDDSGADQQVVPDSPATDDAVGGADDTVIVPLEQPQPVIDPVDPVPAAEQNLPPVDDGDAIARIEIPRIGVNDIVVAGVAVGDLKRGPGHFPDTPLPGQLGNAAIAGHRTTYGAPFFDVNELEPGDEIVVTTLNGRFVYRVTGDQIVPPTAYGVVATTDPAQATLTLVSCHPRYTAQQRIIVSATLDVAASGPVGEPVLDYGRPDTAVIDADGSPAPSGDDGTGEPAPDAVPTDTTLGDADAGAIDPPASSGSVTGNATVQAATPEDLRSVDPDASSVEVFGRGWFSDPGAPPHVAFWGIVVAAIAALSFLVSRRLRRDWAGLLVGIVPFVVALYFFFQNVNRLLPPNL